MPTPTKGPRLGGSPDHQKALLANLATSLFTHGKIHTTRAKAERLRPYAERLITKAKRGDLHNRRIISRQIRDKDVVHRLMAEIGPFFADRPGGYTRITKTLPRKGDNAPMAIIELVAERTATAEASQATRTASQPAPQSPSGPGAHAGEAAIGAESGPAAIGAADTGEDIDVASATGPGLEGADAEVADAEGADAEGADAEGADAEGAEGEVPEPMAENAASSAGLDTEDEASDSGDKA